MAVITVTAANVPMMGSTATSLTLRVFSTNCDWATYEGLAIQQGDGGLRLPWYTDYTCPVTSHVAAVPALTLHSTTDRPQQWQDPRWTAIWLDAGTNVGVYFSDYQVPATPTTTTKAALDAFQPGNNNNQRWNPTAYNTIQSNLLFPRLTGLTPGTLPKVQTVEPAVLVDSLFSDDGTDAIIAVQDGVLQLGNDAFAPQFRRIGGGSLEIVDQSGSAAVWFSGGVRQTFGRISLVTLNANSTASQVLFTASSGFIPTMIIFANNSADMSAQAGTIEIGYGGFPTWASVTVASLDLPGPVGDGHFGIIFAPIASRGVPTGIQFQAAFTNALGVTGFVDCHVYGFYADLS